MKKLKILALITTMILTFSSCQLTEEVEYTPVKTTGKEAAEERSSENTGTSTATDDAGSDSSSTDTQDSEETGDVSETADDSDTSAEEVRVIADSLNIRSNTSVNAQVVTTAINGQVLNVIKTEEDDTGQNWYHVETQDTNQRGYVSGEFVEVVQ